MEASPRPIHPRIHGSDLEGELVLSAEEASQGLEVKIAVHRGEATPAMLLLRVPPGTVDGTRLRFAGQGLCSAQGDAGSLFVSVTVVADERPAVLEPEVIPPVAPAPAATQEPVPASQAGLATTEGGGLQGAVTGLLWLLFFGCLWYQIWGWDSNWVRALDRPSAETVLLYADRDLVLNVDTPQQSVKGLYRLTSATGRLRCDDGGGVLPMTITDLGGRQWGEEINYTTLAITAELSTPNEPIHLRLTVANAALAGSIGKTGILELDLGLEFPWFERADDGAPSFRDTTWSLQHTVPVQVVAADHLPLALLLRRILGLVLLGLIPFSIVRSVAGTRVQVLAAGLLIVIAVIVYQVMSADKASEPPPAAKPTTDLPTAVAPSVADQAPAAAVVAGQPAVAQAVELRPPVLPPAAGNDLPAAQPKKLERQVGEAVLGPVAPAPTAPQRAQWEPQAVREGVYDDPIGWADPLWEDYGIVHEVAYQSQLMAVMQRLDVAALERGFRDGLDGRLPDLPNLNRQEVEDYVLLMNASSDADSPLGARCSYFFGCNLWAGYARLYRLNPEVSLCALRDLVSPGQRTPKRARVLTEGGVSATSTALVQARATALQQETANWLADMDQRPGLLRLADGQSYRQLAPGSGPGIRRGARIRATIVLRRVEESEPITRWWQFAGQDTHLTRQPWSASEDGMLETAEVGELVCTDGMRVGEVREVCILSSRLLSILGHMVYRVPVASPLIMEVTLQGIEGGPLIPPRATDPYRTASQQEQASWPRRLPGAGTAQVFRVPPPADDGEDAVLTLLNEAPSQWSDLQRQSYLLAWHASETGILSSQLPLPAVDRGLLDAMAGRPSVVDIAREQAAVERLMAEPRIIFPVDHEWALDADPRRWSIRQKLAYHHGYRDIAGVVGHLALDATAVRLGCLQRVMTRSGTGMSAFQQLADPRSKEELAQAALERVADLYEDVITREYLAFGDLDYQTLDSGVSILCLAAGEGGRKPLPSDQVRVEYAGFLLDGRSFDRSPPGQTVLLPLEAMIAGFQEGICHMELGSWYRLMIPPQHAYGRAGQGLKIPAYATLVFDVHLVAIE
jgi:FKBP-type peptidyl-prolyl cis-trans isomerase